jgi:hypothetical protein
MAGKQVSKQGRATLGLKGSDYVYGEIRFDSFSDILGQVRPILLRRLASLRRLNDLSSSSSSSIAGNGLTFYDIGSGTGKAVVSAMLSCDFTRCVGVELVPDLHMAGVAAMERWEKMYLEPAEHVCAVCESV